MIPILIGVLIITVSLLIRAEFADNKRQIYIFKPISTLLIIIVIINSFFANSVGQFYKQTILLGMVLSMGGDVALMFESRKAFLSGLVLFLLGHIAYTVTLVYHNGFLINGVLIPLIIGLVGLAFFAYLYSGLKNMKLPVLFYILVISLMLNSALLSYRSDFFNTTQAWQLATGATLFYLSDVVLAINKFKIPFRLNRLSLIAYFSGQLFIALSTHYF